jgi:hypothetical protein
MINYCIITHSNPNQLKLLINAIHEKGKSRCIIHVDKKEDIQRYILPEEDIYFLNERVDVRWGTFTVVDAVIKCLAFVTNNFNDGYFILLSGMDLPIKNKNETFNFIDLHSNKVFLKYELLPSNKLKFGGLDRIHHYWFDLGRRGNLVSIKPLSLGLNNIISLYRIARYNPSLLLEAIISLFTAKQTKRFDKLVYGEMWWGAPFDVVKSLLSYLENNKEDFYFFHRTKIPDEIFLQTILLERIIRDKYIVYNQTLSYIEWSSYRWPRPTTFRIEDFWTINKIMQETNYLFARKFDERIDKSIIIKLLSILNGSH